MRKLFLLWISVVTYVVTSELVPTPWLKTKDSTNQRIINNQGQNYQDQVIRQYDLFVVATSPSSYSPVSSAQTKRIIQQEVHHAPLLSRSSARWMLVLCAFMYGTTYPLTKLLQESMHPSMVTALRFNIAAVFFVPQLKHVWNHTQLLLCSMELGLWCSIGFISQAMVLSETSASKAAFFGGLSVVMPPLFELIMSLMEKGKSCWLDHSIPTTTTRQLHPQPWYAAANVNLKASATATSSAAASILARVVKSPLITPALALCGAAWLACGGINRSILSYPHILSH